MLEKLDHFSINSKSPKALAEWYRDVLGLEIVMEMKPSKRRKLPVYYLKPKDGSLIEVLPPNVTPHLAFEVDDFDKAAEELASKNVKLRDVRVATIGWKVGFFDDPDGHEVEIVYRPKGTPRYIQSFTKE